MTHTPFACAALFAFVLSQAGCPSRGAAAGNAEVNACVSALDNHAGGVERAWKSATEQGVFPSNRALEVEAMRACGTLYKRRACRNAEFDLMNAGKHKATVEAARAQLIVTCTAAYCLDLHPAPSLCSKGDTTQVGPSAMASLWEEFQDAALSLDIGPTGASRVRNAMTRASDRERAARELYVNAGSPKYSVVEDQ